MIKEIKPKQYLCPHCNAVTEFVRISNAGLVMVRCNTADCVFNGLNEFDVADNEEKEIKENE